MKLTFPFQNLAFNNFDIFISNEFIKRFTGHSVSFSWDTLEKSTDDFNGYVADYENEVLQIINTTNQDTIDDFFVNHNNIYEIVSGIDVQFLTLRFDEYNKETEVEFEAKAKEDEEEYFKKEERFKYKHLEKYQKLIFGFLLGGSSKNIEVTNYNYYCIEHGAELADLTYLDSYIDYVISAKNTYLGILEKFRIEYTAGRIKARTDKFFSKVIVYVEGAHDITFIKRAAELFDYGYLFDRIELRQRGGFRNLDKIWDFYKECSVEITPQKKLLLYDCDTQKKNDDFGFMFKRIIPTMTGHYISKGIENLFGPYTTQKALAYKKEFLDITHTRKTVRGIETITDIWEVNKEEKANFCTWLCENGTKEDFQHFEGIFQIIKEIINL